jgi:hypothetical protein
VFGNSFCVRKAEKEVVEKNAKINDMLQKKKSKEGKKKKNVKKSLVWGV